MSSVILAFGCQSGKAEIWIHKAKEEKDLDKKIAYYNNAIKIDDQNPWSLNDRGQVFLYLEKYEDAMKDFKRVIAVDPLFIDGYNNIAIVYEKTDKLQKALAYFTLAIEKKADRPLYYSNRGLLYDKLERYDEALSDYEKALEIDPEYLPATYNRGLHYRKTDKHNLAIADFEKVLRFEPDLAVCKEQLAGAKMDAAIKASRIRFGIKNTQGQ